MKKLFNFSNDVTAIIIAVSIGISLLIFLPAFLFDFFSRFIPA